MKNMMKKIASIVVLLAVALGLTASPAEAATYFPITGSGSTWSQNAANVRGRVFAIEQVMWNTAPLTSFIVTGISIDAFGVQPVYVTLAVLVLGASVVLAFAPQLRSLRDQYDRRAS